MLPEILADETSPHQLREYRQGTDHILTSSPSNALQISLPSGRIGTPQREREKHHAEKIDKKVNEKDDKKTENQGHRSLYPR